MTSANLSQSPSTDEQPAPPRPYILLIATPTEEKELKKATQELGLRFDSKTLSDPKTRGARGSYWDLGELAGRGSPSVLAIRAEMGAHGFLGSASKAIHFQAQFSAQAVICIGMAFGVDRANQEAGDVLISVGLLPYDDRIVRCGDDGQHQYEFYRLRMHPAKESLVRAFERHRDIHDAEHDVHFGLLLSGSLRVQCGSYRDKLAADAGIAAQGTWTRDHGPDAQLAPIVGGEMEGLGLLAISSVDTPRWIIVKGISDFADGKDQDLFKARRTLACANSARFVLRALIAEESERGAA